MFQRQLVSLRSMTLFILGTIAFHPNHANTLLRLASSSTPFLKNAVLVKPLESEKKLSLTVWLKLRHQKKLAQLAQDVYDPNSSRYQQFLTKAVYERDFAPGEPREAAVKAFFIAHGMQAKSVRHHILVSGTVRQIEQALQLKLNQYKYQNQLVYAPSSAPKLDSSVAQYILDISGLSTLPEYQSNSDSIQNNNKESHDLNFLWDSFRPTATPTNISLQGFTGAQLQKVYNLKNIPAINGVHLQGEGQTLVIVDKCGTNGPADILSDANQYFNANGIKPFMPSGPLKNFSIIKPDGSRFTGCPNASAFSREIVLDIESSHTLAPGDNTVLVLGPSDQKSILMEVINTLIQDNYTIAGFSNAYVISNSWSGPEQSIDHSLEAMLELAAASGISVNFSSGDCGDNTYSTQSKCTGSGHSSLAVNYPSSSAYVTAVGATALFVDSRYAYAFETVWGSVKPENASYVYDGGTGGGISQFYGPVGWQGSISNFTAGGYGVISTYGNRRALPDIAMLGDPRTGLLIVAQGAVVQDGGTSLACPLFSATLLLVNQARSLLNKETPIGHAAPYLYQMNQALVSSRSINLIIPPALIINGAIPAPTTSIQGTPTPASSFMLNNYIFGWDSSLSVEPEAQYWNDAVGVGSPNIPNFVHTMANF